MKKKTKKVKYIIVILLIMISVKIISNGIKQFGNNWIDFSREPSICYYDGRVYYEISYSEYYRLEGKYELMDKYITLDGSKANILEYFIPRICFLRVGETRNSEGTPIALSIGGLDIESTFYKLSEEESQ